MDLEVTPELAKLKAGRWRLGWKIDVREGMHLRSWKYFLRRPTLPCGCWRIWIGRMFFGRKCKPDSANEVQK